MRRYIGSTREEVESLPAHGLSASFIYRGGFSMVLFFCSLALGVFFLGVCFTVKGILQEAPKTTITYYIPIQEPTAIEMPQRRPPQSWSADVLWLDHRSAITEDLLPLPSYDSHMSPCKWEKFDD